MWKARHILNRNTLAKYALNLRANHMPAKIASCWPVDSVSSKSSWPVKDARKGVVNRFGRQLSFLLYQLSSIARTTKSVLPRSAVNTSKTISLTASSSLRRKKKRWNRRLSKEDTVVTRTTSSPSSLQRNWSWWILPNVVVATVAYCAVPSAQPVDKHSAVGVDYPKT